MKAASQPSIRNVESLGKLIYETKPNVSNLIAGMVIAALLIGGGPTLSAYMIRQMFFAGGNPPRTVPDWFGAAVLVVFGIALAVGGISLLLWVQSLFRFCLRICEEGFYFTRGSGEIVFAWNEIREVRETVLSEKLPLVKGPALQLMPTKTSRNYTVVRCDGLEFYFDENVVPRTSLLAGPLASAARNVGFSWQTTEQHS
jgi:hypothetical protein